MELPQQPANQPHPLYNPTNEEFTWDYLDDQNNPHTAKMPAGEITFFPSWLADVVAKHLADKILHDRGIRTNVEYDLHNILEEIKVEI